MGIATTTLARWIGEKVSAADDPALVEAPLSLKTRLRPRSLVFRHETPPDEHRLRRHFERHRFEANRCLKRPSLTVHFRISRARTMQTERGGEVDALLGASNRVGAVWAGSLLCGLLAFVGCSGSSSSNSCVSCCDNLCSSLEACEVEVQDCRSSCENGLNDRACKGQAPPDRLTCAELTDTVACADYCVALCDRAPDCGSFDPGACVNGCWTVGPGICNGFRRSAHARPAQAGDRQASQGQPKERSSKSGCTRKRARGRQAGRLPRAPAPM
jgi:hypothetical protein